ncbi:MAG: hypothetical protein E2598_11890 [Sphingobium sp.]|nr:hypothetical protein [Sphingobium sp.]
MILAAAASTTPVDVPKARKDYASCLSSVTTEAIDKKQPREEFLNTLKSKCGDKETAFRGALIASNKADGMNDADSKQDAEDQVAEYVDKMTRDFDSAK